MILTPPSAARAKQSASGQDHGLTPGPGRAWAATQRVGQENWKSVFDKIAARSRGELVARLQPETAPPR